MRPSRVHVALSVDPQESERFRGEVAIDLKLARAANGAARRSIRLHAVDLAVTRPRLELAGRTLRGRITRDAKVEMVEIHFDEPLPRGEAKLRLAFAGRLRTDLCGLYGVTVGERRYAFTQLEATSARKFFPCFDEPAMKARFRLSVTTPARNQVVSNATVAKVVKERTGGRTVHFAETPPLSSYLVALAVGRLQSSKPLHLGPTEIRVWHTPGKQRLTGFALEAARECLSRLERYFGLPYPYAKLDLVAVPDFEFGAMENAGAVFFRETVLLLEPATATLPEQKRAAEVICHELAHMWYGDLVTMEWWDDLWLNEAFATWMAFHIVDDWRPEWKMWRDFQHGRAAALELDALRHTHPIYCEVVTADQADENFDLITYEKGASVVRMLERYLGANAFRRGVRDYIREHAEGNTVARDLWRALGRASGEDVEQVARAWIEQKGHPVVRVRRRIRGRTHELELSQTRFTETPRRPARGRRRNERWPIPWIGRIGTGPRRTRLARQLLTRTTERVPLSGREPRFVYGNADESGFFRPLHSEEDFAALVTHFAVLSTTERMGLVDHQWALVRAGIAPLGPFLDLVSTLGAETESDVLAAASKALSFLSRSLVPDAAPASEAPFRQWVRDGFGPALEELSLRSAPRESDATRLRRAALLQLVGGVGADPAVLAEVRERCDRFLANRRSLDPNLADGVVGLAARTGGAKRHRELLAAMKTASTPQEQRRFLLALADFRHPASIDRTLALTLKDVIPTQDLIFVLARLLANPAARETTWRFVKRHWGQLSRRVPSLLASRLIDATPSLLTPAHRTDVARFFRAHPVPSGERALRQALERFDWYRGFRRRAARELTDWLG